MAGISSLNVAMKKSRDNVRIDMAGHINSCSPMTTTTTETPLSAKDLISVEDGSFSRVEAEKQVSFNTIEIREYPICLEEHPATTCGPSIGIGWKYAETESLSLEAYEKYRPPRRNFKQNLILPYTIRYRMLIASGFTKVEIDESMNNVKKYRHQRLISFALQDFDNFYLFIESAKRKLHRLRKRVSKQKEQGLSWENTRISKSL